MIGDPVESHGVSLVDHSDLDGRPGFKMALQEADGRLYMYLGHFWHSGWTVVDVTDPHDLEVVTFVEGPENSVAKNIQVADGLMVCGLERPAPNWGPVGDLMDPSEPFTEGAYLFDVESDPRNPAFLGHYETGGSGTHRNFYNGGDYAYMIAWPEEFTGGMLAVVDVSDPTAPEEVGQWWWPGQHEDDAEEADLSFYGHGPAYVQGDRAYLAYGRVGPVVLDVSEPTEPELISRLAMGDGLGSWLGTHSFIPLPDSDLAAVTTEAIREVSPLEGGEGLNYTALVDVSDVRPPGFGTDESKQEAVGPKFLSTMPIPVPGPESPYDNYHQKPGRFGPHNLHHSRDEPLRYQTSDYLVMTWFNSGLRIFDIRDPLAPAEVAHYVPQDPDEPVGTRPTTGTVTHFEDVVVDHRGYIYCTDTNNGLFVFEADVL